MTIAKEASEIRECEPHELDAVRTVINDGAIAYRGVIADDCWHDPYMTKDELQAQVDAGVRFWACVEADRLLAVMGLQNVLDVALIRHAYTRSSHQRRGIGAELLARLRATTDRPLLVGTWTAATWAVSFYERHGFRLVGSDDTDLLLRRYWTIADRQIEESVVLADARWFAKNST
jgi:GNAT superfamily N-acetyltransferase